MRITVFGTGYLGATHAACMAELGHEVLGVDVDPASRADGERDPHLAGGQSTRRRVDDGADSGDRFERIGDHRRT